MNKETPISIKESNYQSIIKEKEYIIKDVVSQFEVQYKGHHSEEQQFKCVRDTGYNFDAIVSDLEKGGIKNVLEVAKRYWQGRNSNLGIGQRKLCVEVNKLLERRLHQEDVDKDKVTLLINIMNEIVQFGFSGENRIK